ncbi:MAG: alpha-glucosidase, partial [Bacteroidia bacterium]|nr:alpha-glucosidase [Bacteroidia bacterium]
FMIDLSNPEAKKWFKTLIQQNLIQKGLSGWMADFGEWLPYDAILHQGKASHFHHEYIQEWIRLQRETIHEWGLDTSHIFFNRAGFSGCPKYMNSLWAGDQMTSFQKYDGMPSALNAILTAGLSGFTINHADIGGYTNLNLPFFKKYLRSPELLIKWTEMSAFFPIFRTHEGLIPRKNYQFYTHDTAIQHFTRWAKIHYQLKFYFKKYVEEAIQTGLPVIRHLLIEYPELEASWQTHHGFLLGTDLLIYPYFNSSKTKVFLPKETWYCVNNQLFYSDGFYEFNYPQVLIFIRKQSEHFNNLKQILQNIQKF